MEQLCNSCGTVLEQLKNSCVTVVKQLRASCRTIVEQFKNGDMVRVLSGCSTENSVFRMLFEC